MRGPLIAKLQQIIGARPQRAGPFISSDRQSPQEGSGRKRHGASSTGITVNAICPGYSGTEMVQAIDPVGL